MHKAIVESRRDIEPTFRAFLPADKDEDVSDKRLHTLTVHEKVQHLAIHITTLHYVEHVGAGQERNHEALVLPEENGQRLNRVN